MDSLIYASTIICYVIGYLAFAYSVFRNHSIRLSYGLGIFIFLTLQYGPHTVFFTDMLRLSIYADSESVNQVYSVMMGFVFLVFGALFVMLPKVAVTAIVGTEKRSLSLGGLLQHRKRFFWALFIVFSISFFLQGGGGIAIEHFQFIRGSSFFSYKEIRRELFADSLWFKFSDLVRFSIVPVIYSYFIVLALVSKRYKVRFGYIAIAVIFVLTSVIQLNKFFFLYYSVLSLLIYFALTKLNVATVESRALIRKIPFLLILMSTLLVAILLLYKVQYSQALDSGLISFEDIVNTLFFRFFFASSDSLRLWIDYFGISEQYQGLKIIGKLCSLFGECFNPNTFIPYYYLGRDLTSMQAGFMGTALGIGGFFAVPFIPIFVVVLVAINNYVLGAIKSGYLIVAFSPVMFLNSFFLTTRELHTAIISGGAVLTALFIILVTRRFIV